MNIQETLNQRQNTHGEFAHNSTLSQFLKLVYEGALDLTDDDHVALLHEAMALFKKGYARLSWMQREALDMKAHKQARIFAGDPYFHDHWHDDAGYSTCVVNRLPGERI